MCPGLKSLWHMTDYTAVVTQGSSSHSGCLTVVPQWSQSRGHDTVVMIQYLWHTGCGTVVVTQWLSQDTGCSFPETLILTSIKVQIFWECHKNRKSLQNVLTLLTVWKAMKVKPKIYFSTTDFGAKIYSKLTLVFKTPPLRSP